MDRKRVLLVEDNKLLQTIVQAYLEKLDCIVDVVDTSEEGIEFCQKNTYHLIFMDVGLPGLDGISAAQIIREQKNRNQQTPVVVLTAHDDSALRARAQAVGMNDYLVKPATQQSVEEILNKYCHLK